MSDPRDPMLTDDVLRRALTRGPDPGIASATMHTIVATVAARDQVGATRLHLLPPGTPRFRAASLLLIVLALILLAALALFVGSRHPSFPIGPGRNGLLVFDTEGDIAVANADGSGRRLLTGTAADDFGPVFAPDGRTLAFWTTTPTTGPTTPRDLLIAAVDDPLAARVLAHVSGGAAWRIAWSHDGARLAYADAVDGRRRIFQVGLDGAPAVSVSPTTIDAWDPAWSPDDARIAFLGGRFEADRGLYLMNADGSAARRISTVPSRGRGYQVPDWSAVINRIAVAVEAGGADPFQRDIWVFSPDGTVHLDVSNDPADESAPAWSPDGSGLAWLRVDADDPAHRRVVVAAADGSDQRLVGPNGAEAVGWSPDRTRLLIKFATGRSEARDEIVAVDPATGATNVVIAGVIDGDGSWQRLAP